MDAYSRSVSQRRRLLIAPAGRTLPQSFVQVLFGKLGRKQPAIPFNVLPMVLNSQNEKSPLPGAQASIEAVVRSPADGYTLLVVGTTAAINATLFEKLNYNFIRDIAPVASIIRVPHVMQVNPSLPVAT